MNVLIIEDECIIARTIKRICESLPVVNSVAIALDYHDALIKASSGIFDLYLTDIFLGNQHDGLHFCEYLRKQNAHVPIIIITSTYSLQLLEKAFSLGVNDYILKPFHPKELELRIQRWLSGPRQSASSTITYHQLRYHPESHEFFFGDQKLQLTKREKVLMLILLRDSEKLLPSHLIKEKFWGDYSEKSRNIRSNIQSLRKSLGDPCSSWIQTVRGEGYILKKKE